MTVAAVEFNEQIVEVRLWKTLLEQTAFSIPSGTYVGLWTSAPTNASGEVQNAEYSRKLVTWNRLESGGVVTGWENSNTLEWAAVTAFGAIHSYVFLDAPTFGNVLFVWAATASQTVGAGDVLRLNPADLSISLEGTIYPTPLT